MAVMQFKKTKKNGEVYYAWGYCFRDSNGKRHRNESCNGKGEAGRKEREALEKLAKGKNIKLDKTLTFKALSDNFLEYHAKVRCKETTYEWYKKYINTHLMPYFNEYRVININTALINKFIAEKKEEDRTVTKTVTVEVFNEKTGKTENKKIKVTEKKKYGVETINHCLVTLKAIFNYAVKNELISKNPAKDIEKFKAEEKNEMIVLNRDECRNLLDTAKAHYPDFYPILYIAIFTGMREGEILGLCWDKIDFENNKIKVHRSVYEGELREFTKTSSSYRTVDMTNSLSSVLMNLKHYRKQLTHLVFPNDAGKPKLANNMLRRRFYPCMNKAFGTRKIKFHELRHAYVSLLISENIPIKYIQKQVGHSSINITMNTYGHLLPDVHENAVQILDNISTKLNKSIK